VSISTILILLVACLVGWISLTLTTALIESTPTKEEKIAEIKRLAQVACGDEYTIKYQSGYMAFSCVVGGEE
jgi:hypothetical protein